MHPNQISRLKSQFHSNAESLFEKHISEKREEELEKEWLYKVIGQQKIEIHFLKKTCYEPHGA